MFSDDLARPTFTPFVVEAIYTWIECDLPKYPGFKIEVRMNLKNRERKKLNDLLNDIQDTAERISQNFKHDLDAMEAERLAAIESGDTDTLNALAERRSTIVINAGQAHDGNSTRINAAITPYIRAWNLAVHDTETGAIESIPPPATGGVESFDELDQTVINWIVATLMGAYRGGKGFSGSLLMLDEPDAPPPASTETTPAAKPKTSRSGKSRTSPATSPLPSPSISTT